ncbi:uncharacterized protein LOC123529072 [Mercenaria mercenaria]|uniref:uncharacterized protein LOC123529072 n=1 Tax=Mercenaria mercenaria TaxID=6596 RepID=UPI00234F0C4C|nr:uncharacterized protein LOC123529072 [Mercenaria mercenaria]
METDFKLTVRINARETGDAVCFKHDGQRFEQMHTVKLNANTEYELIFTLHPAQYIEKLLIDGEHHKVEICHDDKDEYEDIRTYKTHYETVGYDVCKRGKRKELLLVLELENGVYMKIAIQCKLYKAGETNHSHWGQKLAGLELGCKMEEGHNYVQVLKEKYY